MSRPIRVLVVDDSAFARKVLREVLSRAPGIEVVDIARDGLEALEKINELSPDVVTLDLVMPNLDGLGVLRALPAAGAPRVVVVSFSDAHSELSIEALQRGAVDLVHKPTALATDRLYGLADELVRKVTAAATARPHPTPSDPPAPARPLPPKISGRAQVVVIGTSTGGPQALTRLLTSVPADFPVPIVIALHIPAGYTKSLAARIDAHSTLTVIEAADNLDLAPGLALITPGGRHLALERRGNTAYTRFAEAAAGSFHCPSVNLLFESAARVFGPTAVGVVLTGMGDDGLVGAAAIHAAGGRVLVESESSCVVYGMPRSVIEAGLADAEAPLDALGEVLLAHL
ncbi:Chemotaxis response regulator protein-glutamate methylesterase CheB [Minicystis rosea]|nr:Chemotaxis response regulator protein-glutamate methylesterase CheB [Minicystis rosea]